MRVHRVNEFRVSFTECPRPDTIDTNYTRPGNGPPANSDARRLEIMKFSIIMKFLSCCLLCLDLFIHLCVTGLFRYSVVSVCSVENCFGVSLIFFSFQNACPLGRRAWLPESSSRLHCRNQRVQLGDLLFCRSIGVPHITR